MDNQGLDALGKTLERIGSEEDVVGVSVTDGQGLCLGARGTLNKLAAAQMQAIMDAALELFPDADAPVIEVVTDCGVLLASSTEGYTTCVHKQNK